MTDSPVVFAYSIMLGMAIGFAVSMCAILFMVWRDYKNDKW